MAPVVTVGYRAACTYSYIFCPSETAVACSVGSFVIVSLIELVPNEFSEEDFRSGAAYSLVT